MPPNPPATAAARLKKTVAAILENKGRTVHTIGPDESVYAGVAKLKEFKIGALLVMEGSTLLGVISERDYARKIILEGRASKDTAVKEIMSSPVITVGPTEPLADCMRLMHDNRIRHLPILEANKVIGVISIGDLMREIILQQEETIGQLNTLISDPYPS